MPLVFAFLFTFLSLPVVSICIPGIPEMKVFTKALDWENVPESLCVAISGKLCMVDLFNVLTKDRHTCKTKSAMKIPFLKLPCSSDFVVSVSIEIFVVY